MDNLSQEHLPPLFLHLSRAISNWSRWIWAPPQPSYYLYPYPEDDTIAPGPC